MKNWQVRFTNHNKNHASSGHEWEFFHVRKDPQDLFIDGISNIKVIISHENRYVSIYIRTHDHELFKKLALHKSSNQDDKYYLDSLQRDLSSYSQQDIKFIFNHYEIFLGFIEAGLRRTYDSTDPHDWAVLVCDTLQELKQFQEDLTEIINFLYLYRPQLVNQCVKLIINNPIFNAENKKTNLSALPLELQELIDSNREDASNKVFV